MTNNIFDRAQRYPKHIGHFLASMLTCLVKFSNQTYFFVVQNESVSVGLSLVVSAISHACSVNPFVILILFVGSPLEVVYVIIAWVSIWEMASFHTLRTRPYESKKNQSVNPLQHVQFEMMQTDREMTVVPFIQTLSNPFARLAGYAPWVAGPDRAIVTDSVVWEA